jgi:hypothetical protein
MHRLVDIPAFRFEQDEFVWGDVVLAALAWGEWQQLERSLTDGLACVAQAVAVDERLDDEAIHADVVAFRRARRLLAGDEYLAWLAERSLSTADLHAHLERAALRRRAGGRVDEIRANHPPDPAEVAGTIRAEAILSGGLQAWAERLARSAAAARGLAGSDQDSPAVGGQSVDDLLEHVTESRPTGLPTPFERARAARILATIAAYPAFAERTVTRDRIERCLAEHSLDWQRFEWDEVTFTREGAAREAAMMVREEHTPMRAVATLGHANLDTREAYFDQASELAGLLASCAPGEVIGPLACDGGWRLVWLRRRTPAAMEDPALRERARAELLEDALGRHLAGRVRWHGQY